MGLFRTPPFIWVVIAAVAFPHSSVSDNVIGEVTKVNSPTEIFIIHATTEFHICPTLPGYSCGTRTGTSDQCTVIPLGSTPETVTNTELKTIMCSYNVTITSQFRGTEVSIVLLDVNGTGTEMGIPRIASIPVNRFQSFSEARGVYGCSEEQSFFETTVLSMINTTNTIPAAKADTILKSTVVVQGVAQFANSINTNTSLQLFPANIFEQLQAWVINSASVGADAELAKASGLQQRILMCGQQTGQTTFNPLDIYLLPQKQRSF